MKNMKKELFTAVAMLLVATVALGTASYAWFVNNATVAVDEMNFKASAASAMEIALAKPAEQTTAGAFKGRILTADLNTFFKSATGGDFGSEYMNNVMLKPASTTTQASFTFFREANGGWDNGAQTVTSFAAITNIGTTSAAGVFMVPMYLRASEAMDVYLTTATSITVKDPASTTNQAIYAVRMAIVPDGGAATSTIFQAKATDEHVATSKNTTTNFGDSTDTNKAISGLTGSTPNLVAQGALLPGATSLYAPKADETVIPPTGDVANKVKVMTLEANTPKLFKVYVWLEGCDWDCVTAIAKGNFDINLQFIGKQH